MIFHKKSPQYTSAIYVVVFQPELKDFSLTIFNKSLELRKKWKSASTIGTRTKYLYYLNTF